MSKIAVIDIGTNSIHMVLAEAEPDGSYKILDRFKDMTRLGDGTFRQRRLSAESRARGVEVLKNLTTLARNKGFDRILMAATSAVREARNSGQFVEEVSESTGVRVKVITGQEEARLIYLGVRQSMDLTDRPTLLVDVGGGSVEIIAGNRKRLLHAESLKLGAIRLKDLFLTKAPPPKGKLRAMYDMIGKELHAALERFRQPEFDRIVISSGMASNLAEIIYLERTGHPIPRINLSTITLKEIRGVEQRLATTDVDTRLGIPGLDPRRVDTLLAATSVVRHCLEAIGH
ncbi:MAG: exopolyphosphatase, partial [Nitrospira sp. SB0672_bin_25]|nr:exopolyphosphatase [Nitrospira sp. SB0672_bin_25]